MNETKGIESEQALGGDGRITTPERPNTTLFGIHSQLLELYQLREDVTADPDIFPADKTEELAAIDKAIDAYIAMEARKVDSIAVVIRQFEAAAEFNKAEAKRYQARAKLFERHADDIEERLIRFMRANNLTVMEGKTARLKLAKNPASVNPRQPDLIPDRFMRKAVTLSIKEWVAIVDCLMLLAERAEFAKDARFETYFTLARVLQTGINQATPAPDLVPIKKEMQLPCDNCKGTSNIPAPAGSASETWPCPACGGSGKRAVAGCELVTDKVRLAIS